MEADDADPLGNEPVLIDRQIIGRATSGGYGHHVKKSLLLGYLQAEKARIGTRCEVSILGRPVPARIIAESPYDPENAVLRS